MLHKYMHLVKWPQNIKQMRNMTKFRIFTYSVNRVDFKNTLGPERFVAVIYNEILTNQGPINERSYAK